MTNNSDMKREPAYPVAAMLTVALILLSVPMALQAQEMVYLNVPQSTTASYSYTNVKTHITPANTAAGRTAFAAHLLGTAAPHPQSAPAITTALSPVPSPGFYPSDLVNFGGPALTNMLSHPIYVNMASCGGKISSCWGNPVGFLKNLGLSTFIQVTDQYTGTTGSYGVGTAVSATQTLYTNTISESDLFGIIHAAVKKLGGLNGYGHMYHVFLPAGVDTCFDQSSVCYSPDNLSSFYFCAYHGSLDYSDIGHVIISIEPYQNVPGCQAAPPNPNGQLADSTNSVLSHELFEAITDPDLDAWISYSSLATAGYEIGDLCEPLGNSSAQFLDSYLTLNGHKYEVQLEYSNTYHACAGQP